MISSLARALQSMHHKNTGEADSSADTPESTHNVISKRPTSDSAYRVIDTHPRAEAKITDDDEEEKKFRTVLRKWMEHDLAKQ